MVVDGYFSSMLLSLYVIFFSHSFSGCGLFLVLCHCGQTLEISSILLNLFRFVLCPGIQPVLETVPCAYLEKNVYSHFLIVLS